VRPLFLLPAALLCCAAAVAQNDPAPPPFTLGRRALFYVENTVGPGTLLKDAAIAGINQWLDSPRERGQGWGALGRRYGFHAASDGASNAIRFGLSAVLHEDTRYFPSHEKSIKRRIKYCILRTYIVNKDNGPGKTFSWSRLAGGYAGGWLANAWAPPRIRTPGDVLIRGTLAIPGEIGNSAFQEFWPDARRLLVRKVFHRH
jgi:hypothetical protein